MIQELDSLANEMRVLRHKLELTNLYHHRMEEFDNLKMEHAFMEAKLLIYQKRSKRNQAKWWELYKEQVGKIIHETFESYGKDEKLYHLQLETYQ